MSSLRQMAKLLSFEGLESIGMAIEAYDISLWDREVQLESIPLDALAFSEWQTPFLTLDQYFDERCTYDDETNEWLVDYVKGIAQAQILNPILVMVTKNGVSLIDGTHRSSALFMFTERTHIDAWVIQ